MDLNALIRELERRGEFARTLTHEQLAESTDSLVLVDAPAEEVLCPQQPQPDQPILLGTPPPSLQQPFLPAPGLDAAPGPSRYLPPTVQHPGLWSNQAAHCSKPQFNNVPVVNPPQSLGKRLVPIGFVNGQVIYRYQANKAPVASVAPVAPHVPHVPHVPHIPHVPHVPPVNRRATEKRKFHRQPDPKNVPYVKKPPNSFMIYRKEQTPKIVAELGTSDCAAVNTLLGQRWNLMSNIEQRKYYTEADREMQVHNDLFPKWTAADNYGKKRKRIRRLGPAETGQPNS